MPHTYRARLLPVTLALMGVLGLACMHEAPPARPTAYHPAFSYTPTPSTDGSGISIGIVSPASSARLSSAIVSSGGNELPIGKDARDAIGRALLDYFTASGFTVSGPFATVDEMTFPEKKQVDLVLTIDYDLVPEALPVSVGRNPWSQEVDHVTSEGKCSLGGQISFVLWEPLSMQRMWSKSVAVPRSVVDCTLNTDSLAESQTLRSNALGKLYEAAYASTTATIERYFSPDEVALVKSQAAELRERKVY